MESFTYGNIFKFKDLGEYEKGKATKTVLFSNDAFSLIEISFDDDAELAEHTAPGDAIITALHGKADLVYEGKSFALKEGDSFAMKKGAVHSLKADGKFKMTLLLNLA